MALLAACGGGGGGGNVTPPGGGNGGGNPTPTPVSSSSASPTPAATATPTTTPTATPTPVQTATPTPGPSATPNSKDTVRTGDGIVNGTDDLIKSSQPNQHNNSGEGNLMPGDPGAVPQGGGQGALVDNISCNTTMSNDYHVHAFVGLIVNGQEVAIPDGIGMVDPYGEFTDTTDPNNPVPNQEIYAQCFYFIHTHDASGLVHLEAPSSFTGVPPCGKQANPPYSVLCTGSYFTLGNMLDVWGISLTPANFGPFSGQVGIYSTPPGYVQCPPGPCYTPSNKYVAITDPTQWTSIPFYHLTAIWIVVGPQPDRPASLPNIEWITGGGS